MSSYSGILDVAIGMVFIYLLLSLICSALTEMVETWLKQRGKNLWKGLAELLNDKKGSFVEKIYKDPLIYGLYRGDKPSAQSRDLPSYIPPRNFALALLNQIVDGQSLNGQALTVQHLKEGVQKASALPESLKPLLLVLLSAAGDDLENAIKSIEEWYNNGTDRVAGWYKRHAQWVAFSVGLATAIVGNVDSITLVQSLASDDSLRSALVTAASEYAKGQSNENRDTDTTTTIALQKNADSKEHKEAVDIACKAPDSEECQRMKAQQVEAEKAQEAKAKACEIKTSLDCKVIETCEAPGSTQCRYYTNLAQLKSLGLPIGWNTGDPRTIVPSSWAWVNKLIGLLLTAIAISFGAPFWFDTLNKFMKFRSSVRPEPKEDKPKTASKK